MTTKLEPQWIVGFVDGEGCFNLDVHMNAETQWGVQMQPEFTVVQVEADVQVLHALKVYFGCGKISVNRKDATSTRMMFRVKNIEDLNTKIIPFFEKHKLKTKKGIEFQRFREIVRKMHEGYHRKSLHNFLELVKLGEELRVRSLEWKGYKSEKLKVQLLKLRAQSQQNPNL